MQVKISLRFEESWEPAQVVNFFFLFVDKFFLHVLHTKEWFKS